jgi:hypothetical protein
MALNYTIFSMKVHLPQKKETQIEGNFGLLPGLPKDHFHAEAGI